MKRLFIICMLLLAFMGEALAWGQTGHRTVGLIAQEYLKPKVRKKINALLQGNSLAEVAIWMDEIKSDKRYDYTEDWHWVTIPEGMTYEQTQKNPNGDLVMKIEELYTALKKGGLSPETQREYLMFLVHLMGDLHQPMHVGQKNDRGGNDVKLEWFGRNSNLHRVWDSDMIQGKELSFSELAKFINRPAKNQVKAWQNGDAISWATESQGLLPQLYQIPENRKLGYEYSYQHWHTVEQQLLKAGIRLAGLLNEIWG